MIPAWIWPKAPQSGAIEINFAQLRASGTDVAGQTRQAVLAGVGSPPSPGEWTLYLLRTTYWENPDLPTQPAFISALTLQVGTDRGRRDLFGLERRTVSPAANLEILAQAYRGVCVHVAGGGLDAGITYVPGNRTVDDSILAWVAPGRPQIVRVEGRGVTNPSDAQALAERLRLPVFSRRIRGIVSDSPLWTFSEPRLIFYSGPAPIAEIWLPIPGIRQSIEWEWMIPDAATHFSFVDTGAGASPGTIPFQFEVES
jgi:hypothetical protein